MKKVFTLLIIILPGIAIWSQNCSVILDSSFGNAGMAVGLTDNANYATSNNIVVQPDGKIVQLTNGYNGNNNYLIILRYSSNGSLDMSFGLGGQVTTSIAQANLIGRTVALQPDGKIVVAGTLNYSQSLLLTRYNTNGTVDNSFGSDGKTIVPGGSYYYYNTNGLRIQPDGKIIVIGLKNDGQNFPVINVVRFNVNGSVDSAFGQKGNILSRFGHFVGTLGGHSFNQYYYESANDVAIQEDEKILVAATTYSHDCRPEEDHYGGIYLYCKSIFALARYNPDGGLDTTFGIKGKVLDSSLLQYSSFVTQQPDGKIIVSGKGYNNEIIVSRYNSNGTPDNSFGTGGTAIVTHPDGFYTYTLSSILQPDGKMVLSTTMASNNSHGVEIIRFNSNGTPDNDFYGQGKVIFNLGAPGSFADMKGLALQNGQLLAGGDIRPEGVAVVRLSGITPPILPVDVLVNWNGNRCAGDSIKLSVKQNGLIQWRKDGVAISGASDTVYFAKSTGAYSAKVTNADGCGESVKVNIFINNVVLPIPVVTPNNPVSLCSGQQVLLSTTAQGYLQWYNKGEAIAGAYTSSFNASDSGIYSVSVTNNYGCRALSSNTVVTLKNSPVSPFISARGALGFCKGSNVVLFASSNDQLQWYNNNIPINGATDSLYTAAISGNYTVAAINSDGCKTASSHVVVSAIEPPKPFITWNTPLFSAPLGYVHYKWYLNDTVIAASDNDTYRPVQPGSYKVEVTDNFNCTNVSENFQLVVLSTRDIVIGGTTIRYYPNPVQTILYIDVPSSLIKRATAQLYDLLGRKLLDRSLKRNQNRLPVGTLPSGIYQLVIQVGSEKQAVKVLVTK